MRDKTWAIKCAISNLSASLLQKNISSKYLALFSSKSDCMYGWLPFCLSVCVSERGLHVKFSNLIYINCFNSNCYPPLHGPLENVPCITLRPISGMQIEGLCWSIRFCQFRSKDLHSGVSTTKQYIWITYSCYWDCLIWELYFYLSEWFHKSLFV